MYKNWSITKGADAAPIFPVEYKEWKCKKGNIKSDIENCSYKYTPPRDKELILFFWGGGVLSLLGKIFELQVYYAKPTHTPRNRNFMTLGNALFLLFCLSRFFMISVQFASDTTAYIYIPTKSFIHDDRKT